MTATLARTCRACAGAGILALAGAALPGCDRAPAQPPQGPSTSASHDSKAPVTRKVYDSGLIVEDLTDGAGAECPRGATVEVDFTGILEDGRVFDSTEMRRTRLILPLARPSTIEGLREGIPGMRVGGKRRIIIPWPMAYGEQGRDPIPPMANLTFEVTLVKIVDSTGGAQKQ